MTAKTLGSKGNQNNINEFKYKNYKTGFSKEQNRIGILKCLIIKQNINIKSVYVKTFIIFSGCN